LASSPDAVLILRDFHIPSNLLDVVYLPIPRA
jgi:hypothetical protein